MLHNVTTEQTEHATVTAVTCAAPHLVIHSLDVGDIHVVGGGTNIFILFTREDVDTNQVHLHKQENVKSTPK